jgi:hypothetical protein
VSYVLQPAVSSLSVPWQRPLKLEILQLHAITSLLSGEYAAPELSKSQSCVITDAQSASLSWSQAPIWGLRPGFYYRQTVAGLLMWSVLSDERMGLSFTIAAGPRQRSHSWL